MGKEGITIGICAYNEENNIRSLLQALLNQQLEGFSIDEIIVISDGSTDQTNKIISDFCKLDGRVKLVALKHRKGKAMAINQLLKIAKSKYIALECADTLPGPGAIEKLCQPLLCEDVGITTGRPIPITIKKTPLAAVVKIEWELHHQISLIQPKFCDLIVFKNIIEVIPPTSSDEEWIAALILAKGLKARYVSDAIFYMKGPEDIRDFLSQRRRNFASHLFLEKKTGYKVATLSGKRVFRVALRNLSLNNLSGTIAAILLEVIGRFLGMMDFILGREYALWRVIQSTRSLLNDAQLNGVYWDQVARNCDTGHYHLEENIAQYKREEHLRLLNRWDINTEGKTILKTDLFEESFGKDGFLFDLSQANNNIVGIDISYEIVRNARLRNCAARNSARFVVSDVKATAFKENSFDLVISNSTLDHLLKDDVGPAMREIKRILKPNGVLVLTLDNKHNLLYLLGYRIQQIFKVNKFYLAGCYSMNEAIQLAESHNFIVQALTTIVHIPTPFNKIALLWRKISRKSHDKIIRRLLKFARKTDSKKMPIFSGWFIALKLIKV